MRKVPFFLPDIGDEEINEVVASLRSGWLTTGPKTRQFEAAFAAFLGGEVQALAVNSATSGLHLALEAAGVGPGDEVVTSTYTFTATGEVIRYLGAHPVLVDCEPDGFNINAAALERHIGPRTKAVIPVHFGGQACDMDPIIKMAREKGLKVIEDAAHAFPTTYRGRTVGTLETDATVFSFYATKTITTGEGGMVVTRDKALAARCRVMRLHGIDRDAFSRYTSDKPAWYYEVIAPGFKYNMTDIAASLGLPQLAKGRAFQEKREAIASRYSEALRDLPLKLPPGPGPGDTHAWHLYVIRLAPGAPITRDDFIHRMSQMGISCSVHFIPLHMHPYWRDTYDLKNEDFPNATRAYESAVSLPLFPKMTDADVEAVIEAARQLLCGR